MFCRNCGANIGNSKFCPECGAPSGGETAHVVEPVESHEFGNLSKDLSLEEIQKIYIENDYNLLATHKAVAEKLHIDRREARHIVNKKMTLFKTPIRPSKEQLAKQRIAENNANGVACCPKCGSTSLSANKKGFGIGKAVVGAALTGGIGLAAGNIGTKKVWVTCLSCGHRWKM